MADSARRRRAAFGPGGQGAGGAKRSPRVGTFLRVEGSGMLDAEICGNQRVERTYTNREQTRRPISRRSPPAMETMASTLQRAARKASLTSRVAAAAASRASAMASRSARAAAAVTRAARLGSGLTCPLKSCPNRSDASTKPRDDAPRPTSTGQPEWWFSVDYDQVPGKPISPSSWCSRGPGSRR
jgi:hypothetical protein